MDNINKDPQPLSPEEQLDLMLEKFLDESNSETPVQEDLIQTPDSLDAEDEISDLQPDAALDQAVPVSPEEQLDNLLASFQEISNEPAPELVAIPDEEMEVPELVSFWDIIPAAQNDDSTDQPAEQNDDPVPVVFPLFQQPEAAEDSEDETAEEADVSEDEAEDEIAEDGANEKTSEEETEEELPPRRVTLPENYNRYVYELTESYYLCCLEDATDTFYLIYEVEVEGLYNRIVMELSESTPKEALWEYRSSYGTRKQNSQKEGTV